MVSPNYSVCGVCALPMSINLRAYKGIHNCRKGGHHHASRPPERIAHYKMSADSTPAVLVSTVSTLVSTVSILVSTVSILVPIVSIQLETSILQSDSLCCQNKLNTSNISWQLRRYVDKSLWCVQYLCSHQSQVPSSIQAHAEASSGCGRWTKPCLIYYTTTTLHYFTGTLAYARHTIWYGTLKPHLQTGRAQPIERSVIEAVDAHQSSMRTGRQNSAVTKVENDHSVIEYHDE